MAVFPTLEPDARGYDFGDFPMSKAAGFGGGEVRFNHGAVAIGHELQLDFTEISEASMTLIRDHYRGQQGGHISFTLPAIIWQGHPTVETLVSSTGRWKYTSPPDEQHLQGKLYSVSVALQYVGDLLTA